MMMEGSPHDESLSEFLNRMYHEESIRKRSYMSIAQWAQEIVGVSNAAMSNYMTAKRKPTGENLESLVAHFGLVIFDKIRMPRPTNEELDLLRLRVAYRQATPQARAKIMEVVKQVVPKDKWID